jgi:hypothetical protein
MAIRSTSALVVTLLVAGASASAENLVSGPQVGEKVAGDFPVLFLNGDHAGAKGSPVSVKGYALAALVFVGEVGDPLTALLKQLDKDLADAAARAPDAARPGVFVVFNSDDLRLKQKLQTLLDREGLKRVVLCLGNSEWPARYEVAEEAGLTVALYQTRTVAANFALRKGELDQDRVKAISKALTRVLPGK